MKHWPLFLLLTACAPLANEADLQGCWTQNIAILQNLEQGVCLAENGRAQSVNMATLVYAGWRLDGNKLILTGKSLGNGKTFEFQENWIVKKDPDGTPVLASQEDGRVYRRASK